MEDNHVGTFRVRQLMALLFLIEQQMPIEKLRERIHENGFVEEWKKAELNYKKLVRYYPDEDEEKHYFLATLDAVHNIDPYSRESEELVAELLPIIEILTK